MTHENNAFTTEQVLGMYPRAGEYAEGLAAIMNRVDRGYGIGLDIGPGWYPIVVKLDRSIAKMHPDYRVHQVKEKFGGLRYYCEWDGEPETEALIRSAEEEAWRTCESCGATEGGISTEGPGWITTRCANCRPKPTQLGRF